MGAAAGAAALIAGAAGIGANLTHEERSTGHQIGNGGSIAFSLYDQQIDVESVLPGDVLNLDQTLTKAASVDLHIEIAFLDEFTAEDFDAKQNASFALVVTGVQTAHTDWEPGMVAAP
ncbi:hypothetical protein KIN34_06360 [Cellulomonas sp. DKR-3]|uniref:Uncharacterized protein n=1 Tax=Cellulomonas fulva TaxID=2835530 RepID=A0ABS5TXM8_9CELL|nr:hypothetical protein [Cellulomonas fulva]MBT0993908.1 hypothetical protein [Cellulomonas fulva]